MDYLSAVWFFLLTMAGATCLVPNRMSKQPGWISLGCALLMAAILRLWPLIWCGEKPSESLETIPLLFLMGSVILTLFAARRFSGDRIPFLVVVMPLVSWAILSWLMEPWTIIHHARWFIWAPSLLVLACTLFTESKKKNGQGQVGSRLLAVGIALLAISNPDPPVYAEIIKAIGSENNIIATQTVLGRVFLTTIACSAIAVGAWSCFSQRLIAEKEMEEKGHRRGMMLGALLIVVLIGGWLWTKHASIAADHGWREELKQEAQLIAAATDAKLVAQLGGNRDDVKLPAYALLKERLDQIVKASGSYRFAYLLAMKDNQIVLLVDNEPSVSKDESVAGDVLHDAELELYAGFEHPASFVTGPNADQWGNWITGYAPIANISINRHPIYLGIDDNASQWNKRFDRLRQEKMLFVLILALFVTGLIVINYLTSEARIRQIASEDRLRLSLQGANLVSWEMDIHLQTLLIDQGGAKVRGGMGLPARLTAHEFLTLVHPDDWKIVREAFTGFFQENKEATESEFRLRQKDGSYLWVISRGQITRRQREGERLRAAGLILDISDRKKTELELVQRREESTRLALVAENTKSAVIITSPEGIIEWVNTGFTKITGYSLDEIHGKKPGIFLQGKETDLKVIARMRVALAGGCGFEETLLNYHKDGTPYWVAIECQPLLNEQGNLSGFMAIETDVTRRVEAEKALQNQRSRLQQINITLLTLSNSHEQNITELTDLAARVLGATRVFYGRIENDCFVILAKFGFSENHPLILSATKSLYCEVIQGGQHFLTLHYPAQRGTADPDLADFQTYVGEGVHLNGAIVGSLNLLYKTHFEITDDLHDCLLIISQAIGKEELLKMNRCRLDTLARLEATERSRFSTLLKNIDDAVLVEDHQRQITYANPAFEKTFDTSFLLIQRVSSETIFKQVAPQFLNSKDFLAFSEAAFALGKTSINKVYETVGGHYLAQDFFPILNEGTHYGFMWRYRDITRFKKHQHLLEAIGDVGQLMLNTPLNSSNAWLALVTTLGKKIGIDRVRVSRYRFAPDGSFVESQIFVEWDKKLGQSFHRDEEAMRRYTNSNLEQPAYWLENFLNGCRVYERDTDIVAPLLKKLGTRSFLCIPIAIEGQLWGTMGFHYNSSAYVWEEEEITLLETVASLIGSRLELQSSEKALIAAKNSADEANRAKSTFLATMSHEIRTPLNAVIGVSSLLMETKLEPQQRDYATTVAASGEILLELINDILDYSKIEAGKFEVEKRPFHFLDILIDCLEILARPAKEKKIKLSYTIDSRLPPVLIGDRIRLKQVLLNLVSNAVKFTQAGSVAIHVEPVGDSSIRLKVSDTGIGMNAEVQTRLFTPFMQADSSVTRKYGGTGLGLAISKRLVEFMGGTISVTSRLGEGTTFTIELPLSAGQVEPKEAAAPDLFLVGKSVLIVDDNPINRHFLRDQLHVWGMSSVDAQGGEEALALLTVAHNFSLVLLDDEMSDLDVLSLARAIKKLPQGKKLPLILFSTVIKRVPKEDETLFSATLTKPLRMTQLHEFISSALGGETTLASPASESPPSTSLRVLVAEDNPTNKKVITMMLSRFGVTPVMVDNGLQALEAVQKDTFDLALLDIQMPVMDGLEAARQMRAHFGSKRRPEIIALTANAFKEDREACLAAGMDGYMVKPLTLDRLRVVLKKVRETEKRIENI